MKNKKIIKNSFNQSTKHMKIIKKIFKLILKFNTIK